jgi:hypothetical protein
MRCGDVPATASMDAVAMRCNPCVVRDHRRSVVYQRRRVSGRTQPGRLMEVPAPHTLGMDLGMVQVDQVGQPAGRPHDLVMVERGAVVDAVSG